MTTLSIGDIQSETDLIKRFVHSYRKRFAAVIDGMNSEEGSKEVPAAELQYLRLCIETMDMVLVNQACLARSLRRLNSGGPARQAA